MVGVYFHPYNPSVSLSLFLSLSLSLFLSFNLSSSLPLLLFVLLSLRQLVDPTAGWPFHMSDFNHDGNLTKVRREVKECRMLCCCV